MDYIYASMVERDTDVTYDNAKEFIAPNRSIQTQCLRSFYCPTQLTMEPCPEDHWCSEATIDPPKCDFLSYCAFNSVAQFNFMTITVAILATTLMFVLSHLLIKRQKRSNSKSQVRSPSAVVIMDESAEDYFRLDEEANDEETDNIEARNTGSFSIHNSDSVEVVFTDIVFESSSFHKVVLRGVSGLVPGRSVTAILGPSSW